MTSTETTTPPDAVTEQQVCAMVQVSRTTLRTMIATGEFLPPFHLRRGVPKSGLRWSRAAVRAWIDERQAEAGKKTGQEEGDE